MIVANGIVERMLENITSQEEEIMKLKTLTILPSITFPPSNTSPLPSGQETPLPLPPPPIAPYPMAPWEIMAEETITRLPPLPLPSPPSPPSPATESTIELSETSCSSHPSTPATPSVTLA